MSLDGRESLLETERYILTSRALLRMYAGQALIGLGYTIRVISNLATCILCARSTDLLHRPIEVC